MDLDQVSIRQFVAVAGGSPRFRAKFMPTLTLRPELHTEASREVELFFLADDNDTFILLNRWVGGDVWSEELGDYTNPVWETVVLRSRAAMFESIATGPKSTGHLEWPGGNTGWDTVALELFVQGAEPVAFAVEGALVYTTSIEGAPHDFLVELDLTGPTNAWQIRRSIMGPAAFTLAQMETPSQRSA